MSDSDKEFEKIKVEIEAKAITVHKAARIIVTDGKAISKNWIEDFGDGVTKDWEKCTIHFRVRDTSSYTEWMKIILDDGTVLLDTRHYIGHSGNSYFDVYTFRNGAWVDRFIAYSTEGVRAEQERQKQAELKQKMQPFSDINF